MVAAAALDTFLQDAADLSDDALSFAAETTLRIGESETTATPHEFLDMSFEQGADRSAARALPLLLLPAAARLRAVVDNADGRTTFQRAVRASINLAHSVENEVRLHLARSLDHLWTARCSEGGDCHHEVAWRIACETLHDCVAGGWDRTGRRSVLTLKEPLAQSLASMGGHSIIASRLDAAIRALAPAAMARICISTRARDLLMVLLAAQRRALLADDRDSLDYRGIHALVSARALLTVAEHGDDAVIYEHIDAYADHAALLGSSLRALAAAAEEAPSRAATARRIWPNLVRHVLALHESGHTPFAGGLAGEMALAALMPNVQGKESHLYRETHEDPTEWWDPFAMQSEVESWLMVVAGRALCLDQFVRFLRVLSPTDQVLTGLPWVSALVLADPSHAASSFELPAWLIEMRLASVDAGLSATWQEIIDALVVAGVRSLAPFSE